jgi:phosphatidylglycerol:prolipoprotein diacylglycerol transferase
MLGPDFYLLGIQIPTFIFFVDLAFIITGFFLFCVERKHIGTLKVLLLFAAASLIAPAGGRILASLEFGQNIFNAIGVANGTSQLGGVLIGIPSLYIIGRLMKIDGQRLLGTLALCWALGSGIGRLACFFSGDGCYGKPTSLPWGMAFPHGTIPTLSVVHPTPLYESILGLCIFIYFARKYLIRSAPPLMIFFQVTIFMFAERFFIEFIRINQKYLGLSQAQWISMIAILLEFGLYYYIFSRITPQKYEALFSTV